MDTSKIEKLLAEFPKAPSPHGKDVPVLDVVFADPGNHGFYYRERMPDSRAAFIRTDHIAAAALRSLAEEVKCCVCGRSRATRGETVLPDG